MNYYNRRRAIFSFFSFTIALLQYLFIIFGDAKRSGFTTFSAMLYILFFWILWFYARIRLPMRTLARGYGVPKIRLVVAVVVVVVTLTYLGRLMQFSDVKRFHGYMPFNAFLSIAYSCVGITLVFGDAYLWPLSRILKFGRQYQR